MKKSLLALAVLGAFAGASQAQTSVTLYGKIDLGFVAESGGAASVSKLTSGVSGGSRLGFRGVEDLGGGLKAMFQMETGFCADSNVGTANFPATSGAVNPVGSGSNAPGTATTAAIPNFCTGGNAFMGRQAWVGLSGGFGSVQLGRQYTPAFINLTTIDPFGTGLAGQTTNLFDSAGNSAANPRFNNAVIYTTPNLSGFSGSLAYGFGENPLPGAGAGAGRAVGFSASYSSGPLYIGLGYHNVNANPGSAAAVLLPGATASVRKNTNFGGTYDFGAAKAHFLYQTTKNGAGAYADVADWMLGVSAPLGAGTLLASYINHNDKTVANKDASQFGIGYLYGLSKRTTLYTAFGKISNKNGATFTVGNATDGGSGNRAFNLGVVHNF